MRALSILTGAALSLTLSANALAGPERIDFPEDYRTAFIEYIRIDRPDRGITRFFYVNPEAMAAAVPGEDLPQGTVLVMEDRKVVVDGAGDPVPDAEGRFRPTDEITNVFVMEKQPGWGAAYPPEMRNGDWDYAWFNPDGTARHTDPARFTGCFSCHGNRAGRDYTFTFYKYLLDTRG